MILIRCIRIRFNDTQVDCLYGREINESVTPVIDSFDNFIIDCVSQEAKELEDGNKNASFLCAKSLSRNNCIGKLGTGVSIDRFITIRNIPDNMLVNNDEELRIAVKWVPRNAHDTLPNINFDIQINDQLRQFVVDTVDHKKIQV